MLAYLQWQFVDGPSWLLRTLWNIELALLQFFSVSVMLRTLVSHWHKDAARYTRRSFTDLLITFAWNQISRAIGLVVRSLTLAIWLLFQTFYVVVASALVLAFLAWPFAIVLSFVAGLMLIAT